MAQWIGYSNWKHLIGHQLGEPRRRTKWVTSFCVCFLRLLWSRQLHPRYWSGMSQLRSWYYVLHTGNLPKILCDAKLISQFNVNPSINNGWIPYEIVVCVRCSMKNSWEQVSEEADQSHSSQVVLFFDRLVWVNTVATALKNRSGWLFSQLKATESRKCFKGLETWRGILVKIVLTSLKTAR